MSSHGRKPVESVPRDIFVFLYLSPCGAIERRSGAPLGLDKKGMMAGRGPRACARGYCQTPRWGLKLRNNARKAKSLSE